MEGAEVAARFGIGRLFTLTHEAVVGGDVTDETIVLWNPAAEALFGYTAEEAVGMPLATLVAEELRGQHRAGIRRFRETGTGSLIGGPPVEVPAVTKGGGRLVVALTLTHLPDEDGGRYVVAVIRDVTAQKAAEEALHRSNQAMQDLVATVSHDLRTPLTAVLGYAKLLRDRGGRFTDEQRAKFLDTILESGERAARLVDDLLTVSKLQAHMVETRPERVDVSALAADAVHSTGLAADIEVELGVAVFADADHVRRILVNLLTNAEKYGRPPVDVSAERVGTDVVIRVSDHGDGIADSFRDRLFDKFARHPEHLDVDGTGLGLSIVQGLARANGGDAFLEDRTEGACFGILLPAA